MHDGHERPIHFSGLVTGKKAVVIYTSGVYSPGVPLAFGDDFHSTFFNDWLRFVGIEDVDEIRFAGIALNPDVDAALEVALSSARQVAEELAVRDLEVAGAE